MTLYVYTTNGGRLASDITTDLPVNVDASTLVDLNDNNDIVIRQGLREVTVTDVDALTRALNQVQLVQAERQAMDDRPMTDDHRKAIFAGLADRYGRGISRARRLSIVSAILSTPGHPRVVNSLAIGADDPVTRAEASHVLDVLNA